MHLKLAGCERESRGAAAWRRRVVLQPGDAAVAAHVQREALLHVQQGLAFNPASFSVQTHTPKQCCVHVQSAAPPHVAVTSQS